VSSDRLFSFFSQRVASAAHLTFLISAVDKNAAKPSDSELFEGHTKYLEVLNQLEQKYLAKTDYVCGSAISLADIVGATEVQFHVMLDINLDLTCPKVAAWLKRVFSPPCSRSNAAYRSLSRPGAGPVCLVRGAL
jgi:glutathione S-transferase